MNDWKAAEERADTDTYIDTDTDTYTETFTETKTEPEKRHHRKMFVELLIENFSIKSFFSHLEMSTWEMFTLARYKSK